MRSLVISAFGLLLAMGTAFAQDERREAREGKEGDFEKAKVVKVDQDKNTITLRCEKEPGKEETKTFSLKETEQIKIQDENGRPTTLSAVNKLRPGQEVMIKTEGDKLKEIKLTKNQRDQENREDPNP